MQRRNSQSHAFFLFFVLIAIFAASILARYYVIDPVQIPDSSMFPKFKERSVVWVCKLPQCASSAKEQDYVLAKFYSNVYMIRRIIAMPGDTISISDKGKVITPHRHFKWKGEDAFIQTQSIYIPKIGDTLRFEQLNEVEQDYLISYLHSLGEKVFVKTTLWQGEREINIDRVGATKIANRQVSLKEIDFLPWQDRYLIELQIRRSEPGNSPIKLKRKLYRIKQKELPPTNIAEQDSLQDSVDISLTPPGEVAVPEIAKVDTASDEPQPPPPPEETAEPLDEVIITKDCYFLACEKGSNCPDSRELGYFSADHIVGLHLKTPDKIKAKFVDPALTYVKAAEVVAKDIWRIVKDSAEKAYNFVVEIFKSDEADESEKDDESEDAPSKKVKKPQPTKPRKSAIKREDMEP
ncbi:signal peptidase I [Fibrobacter sp. UWH6]|uniref:signal peptidase I n=1 Tax=Fibrobacter sp. (strain UWH6) TaxID=1896212 RepID=UPI001587CF5F|nr:signal peptidase I [Fibrobacter sp. UWH6]